jgi:hypothetical protein
VLVNEAFKSADFTPARKQLQSGQNFPFATPPLHR